MASTSAHVAAAPSERPQGATRVLPATLCLLFFLSGSSGLMYEVVWLRMLGRTLGNTVYATSTILAVFMGGLAVGSFFLGRFGDRVRRPLMLYALLESGIGLTALLSLGMNRWPIPLYREIYAMTGSSRTALTFGQVAVATIALLLPTALMGATLPSLCAYGVRRGLMAGRTAGILYALNTLGAMVGVLAAGGVLIGAFGETQTVLIGVAINAAVAAIALVMALLPGYSVIELSPPDTAAAPLPFTPHDAAARRVRYAVLVCFGVSGFVSLAMEIVWSRMLALYVGTAIYAFGSMLAVMLAGIGVGGLLGSRVERWKDPLRALARLEAGVAIAVAFGMVIFWYMREAAIYTPPLIMVGPAALLLGIAFPVAVRCYADHAWIIGKRVGELYAWNTIGCILGSLAGGFVLVPVLGTGHTAALLAGLMAVASAALLAIHPKGIVRIHWMDLLALGVAASLILAIGDPYLSVMESRLRPGAELFAEAEGAGATTISGGFPDLPMTRSLLVNGVGMTTLWTGNKLMADLPIWLADSPHDALVICLGMGTAFRSAVRHKDIDVTVVELVPAVVRFMHFYHADADAVKSQPNAHVVVDDGRNYLLMHQRKVDVISIDPAPPLYSAGTVNLYTREFFQLCADRIRPGGVVCLWVPPAPMSESKMILRTFAVVFPYVSVWAGPGLQGFFLLGTHHPLHDVEARIRRGFKDPAAVADLVEWDPRCDRPGKVLALRLCDRDELLKFTSGSPIISDDHPYTEFPLWRLDWIYPHPVTQLDAQVLRQWILKHPSE